MREYRVVTRAEDLGAIANQIQSAGVVGLDIETYKDTGGGALDPRHGHIRLLQLNIDDVSIYVIDAMQTGTLDSIVAALASTKAVLVIHNAKFEQKWFWHKYKLELWPIFCTFRASALLYNGKKFSHDLWSLYERELQIKQETVDLGGSDWSKPNLTREQYDYAAEDVINLLRLRKILRAKLMQMDLVRTAVIEFGVALPEGVVELNGMPVDRSYWRAQIAADAIQATRLHSELLFTLPHPTGQMALPGFDGGWNIDSQQQMLVSLNKMGIKIPDTKKLTMGMLAGKHPIINKVIEYRKYAKRGTSFGDDWLRWVEPDERIHGDYYSLLAAGRYSMSKPNLQQVPRDAGFRNCFRAQPGKVFVLADYSGIEMRIVAEISGDPRLCKVFQDGRDAHYATASLIMGKTKDQITKSERQMAKPVNFGFIYGMMPAKLVLYALGNYGVPMTEKQATTFRTKYFSREEGYYGIKLWHDRELRDIKRSLISRTMSGRLRYLEEDAHNEILNTPIQGTGADGLKIALREMHNRIQKFGSSGEIIHHVHDEIILQVDNDPEIIAAAKAELNAAMHKGMEPFLKTVPCEVEASVGPSWGEAKAA